MIFDPNPLCYSMLQIYSTYYANIPKEQRRRLYICNEGGTRSSKTFDFFHFLVAICKNNKGLKIYCYRDTLKNCKDRTLQDFIDCLTLMNVYNADYLTGRNQSPVYDLFGNTVYFRGLDDDTESQASDICFFNEAVEMTEVSVKNAYMRCSMLCVFDWNPKYTDHWIFEFEGKPNTWFTRSTYQNNKHLKSELRSEIESWCPYMIEDLNLPTKQRRPNLENIKNKTVDDFRWTVYGEGQRGALEGLIFGSKDIPVTYIDKAPAEYEKRWFGLDFGNTTGTWAFSDNRKIPGSIVYDCPIYGSFGNAQEFYAVFKEYYNQNYSNSQWLVICDNANPQHINDLSSYASTDGLDVVFAPCKKFDGCVEWRIGLMKKNGVTLVNRRWIKKEQENYFWDSVNGIQLQKAKKDGHDHFFDSAGMSIQYDPELR